ncbi:MAG: hypothetical protein II153_02695 [Erysipelotrichaceae bacterium]|nr:hypothetical protein [Erysipelotrichaceae bacterium]
MHIKPYAFRKLLHMFAVSITTAMLMRIDTWLHVIYACLTAIVIIYPLLALFEKYPAYKRFFVEKEPGEAKLSMVLLFGMLMVLTLLGWALFNNKYTVLAALLMWGLGDASAALIGIPYGRHRLGRKSLEGTLAMFIVSFLAGYLILTHFTVFSDAKILLTVAISAVIATLTEFFSPSKADTFTVPIVTLLCLQLLEILLKL